MLAQPQLLRRGVRHRRVEQLPRTVGIAEVLADEIRNIVTGP
jgi:hypothetical protein